MSLLLFAHNPKEVYIFTDTLATTQDGEPTLFCNKSFVQPHLNMTMAMTGVQELGNRWNSRLMASMLAQDVDMLDLHTPQQLRQIWQDLAGENRGPMPQFSTIYHFGWSNEQQQFVRYVYRREKDFESECHLDSGFGVKPHPKNQEGLDQPKTVETIIALAERIRSEQQQEPASSRVYIGGELVMVQMQEQGTVIAKVHRFDDYDSAWDSMNRRLALQ